MTRQQDIQLKSSAEALQELADFFDNTLVPIARRVNGLGVAFFSQGEDDSNSWYVDYPPETPELYELNTADPISDLEQHWASQPPAGLEELVPPLRILAEILNRKPPEEEEELSPLVYEGIF